MTRNKPRLHLALYARPKHPNTYHYALLLSSKHPPLQISKHHIKNTLQTNTSGTPSQPWRYETLDLPAFTSDPALLVLVTIGKVLVSRNRIEEIFLSVPIFQAEDGDLGKGFDCVEWVRLAVERLWEQGVVSQCREGGWEGVKGRAVEFVEGLKKEGRFEVGWEGEGGVPVLDLTREGSGDIRS